MRFAGGTSAGNQRVAVSAAMIYRSDQWWMRETQFGFHPGRYHIVSADRQGLTLCLLSVMFVDDDGVERARLAVDANLNVGVDPVSDDKCVTCVERAR